MLEITFSHLVFSYMEGKIKKEENELEKENCVELCLNKKCPFCSSPECSFLSLTELYQEFKEAVLPMSCVSKASFMNKLAI